jgi:nitroreductase
MSNQLNFFDVVSSRRSVKAYDASHQISKDEIRQLLTVAQQAPSSWNLQQWKFLVFDEQAQKEQLLPIAYGQKQVVEASVVIAVLGDLEANGNAELIYSEEVAQGRITSEIKSQLVNQINRAYVNPQIARDEAFLNASLASMQLMLSARAMGYDTCPMRGVNMAAFVEKFDIPSRYTPVMLIALGKSLKPGYPSSRFDVDDVIVWNKFE